jgi:distribution and morphology protein 10
MLDFMDRVQAAFLEATSWNADNSYALLNASSRALLDFPTPRGLRMHLSSLSSPLFATSYSLNSLTVVDGSLSYLYTTVPLHLPTSSKVNLRDVALGYRQLKELAPHPAKEDWEVWYRGERADVKNVLMYGRMYLPRNSLEALYLRRISPARQLRVAAVSDRKVKHGGTILAQLSHDTGKWCSEYIYSSDVSLLGWRGLYNFGRDPRIVRAPPEVPAADRDKPVGRFSVGGEAFYGVANKSAGMSTGVRYTTLPSHPGIPLTMTATVNPLMGHVTTTYAVKVGERVGLASRFEFNCYSYESEVAVGCEVWRGGGHHDGENDVRSSGEGGEGNDWRDEEGVVKARIGQNGTLGLLWEGRVKELLFSVGGVVDFRRREGMVKALGVEVQYSS